MDRRTFIKRGSAIVAITGALAAPSDAAQNSTPEAQIDTGIVQDGKVEFPNEWSPIEGGAKYATPQLPDALPRAGFAVLGLGRLGAETIMPAFARTKHAKLVALITGTPEKARALAPSYGIPDNKIYGYNDFNRIRDDQSIQAIYIVTPNAIHHQNVLACAAAGKHVLCEKPMSATSAEAEDMIRACAAANVKLMVAYRLQYDGHMRAMTQMVRNGDLGKIKAVSGFMGQGMGDPAQWRLKKALAGGGAMYDIGVYPLNTTRFTLGEEPMEVNARIFTTPGDPRFTEVEESVYYTLLFPSGAVATLACSYALHRTQAFSVHGESALAYVEMAYGGAGQRIYVDGMKGARGVVEMRMNDSDQFPAEIDHFALCIRNDVKPRTPGEEGLADMRIVEAVYQSAASGQPVKLPRIDGLDTTRGPSPM